jgi:hypothetical protein
MVLEGAKRLLGLLRELLELLAALGGRRVGDLLHLLHQAIELVAHRGERTQQGVAVRTEVDRLGELAVERH